MKQNKNSIMIESKIQSLQAKIQEIESSFNRVDESFNEKPKQAQNKSFNRYLENKSFSQASNPLKCLTTR
jgi:hypothetical protein